YSIWAPCTHHQSCPLLTHSKHDWCHDRTHVNAPEWFEQVEDLLPMKNRTVTTSYLLARKKTAPVQLKTLARTTGDSLEEKGKTRQLVCRNESREFLTWMHKNSEPQVIPRGELVDLSSTALEAKSNELRLTESIKIIAQPLV
ncbi:MAG: small ribosomal subunit Rsm22 family protein, partial [Pseudobdellovibrio sp.]